MPAALAPPPPAPASAWVLAGVALAVRGAAALLDPVPPRDGIALATTVRELAAGHGAALLDAAHSPLAAALAAPLAAAGLDPVAALTLLAVLASAAAVLPLHAIARRTFDVDAANAAALLYAVTPPLVRLGSTALGEPLLFLFGLLALDAAQGALRHFRPARFAALAGLAAGAAFLARPEGLALLPVLLAAPLPAGGGRPLRNRVAGAAAGLAAFLLVAVPWVAAESAHRGRFEPFPGKSAAVLLGSAAPADPGGAAPADRPSLAAAAVRAGGAAGESIHPAVALFALLGIGGLWARRRCGRALGPAVLLLAATALLLGGVALLERRFGYGGRRHASLAGVALLPFAGAGFLAAGVLLARAGGPFRRPATALFLLLLAAGGPLLAVALLQRDDWGAEAREMGRRLRDLAPAGAPLHVATFGEPRVAWYAGGADVPLLREFGVPPGAKAADAARRGDSLRWVLRSRDGIDFLVLREGDARVPPGVPGPAAGEPVARAGGLRAWRTPRER